jgi:N-acetylneuraminic acid mutarotase
MERKSQKPVKHFILLPVALALYFSAFQSAMAASWVINTPMNLARDTPSTTLLPNGKVLVAGGDGLVGTYDEAFAEVELYDPATRTWTTTNSMMFARVWPSATALPNGKILVAGGVDLLGTLPFCELFDPATGTWTDIATMNAARLWHVAVLLPNGKVLVAGGGGPSGTNGGYISSAELYDPVKQTWTNIPPMNTPRAEFTATLLPSGKVLVVGGYNNSGDLSTAELYDSATGTWSLTGSLNAPRANHLAVLLPNGKVLVVGDDSYSDTSAELYDPSTGLWTMTGAMQVPRGNFAMTLLPNGKLLVSGGEDIYYNAIASAELYDPASGTWMNAGTLVTSRLRHASTLLPNGNVMLVGGLTGNESAHLYIADTELYTSSNLVVAPFILGSPSMPTHGTVQFSFTNTPDVSFIAYGTTNPSLPFDHWTVLNGPLEVSPGVYQLTDTQHANLPRYFYRLRSP